MTAEPVCVSVSLTTPCFWLGAPNMLLFSNKWGVGVAHGRHGVDSCQDNSLDWNLIFTLQLNLLLSRRTGTVWDCVSETHMFSIVPGAETCDVQYTDRLTQDWNMQLLKDTWRDRLFKKDTVISIHEGSCLNLDFIFFRWVHFEDSTFILNLHYLCHLKDNCALCPTMANCFLSVIRYLDVFPVF